MDTRKPSKPRLLMVRKWTTLTHPWTGGAFCALFLELFISGIVMMYYRFPRVEDADRLAVASTLDPDHLRVTPAEALAKLSETRTLSQVRLNVFDGWPALNYVPRRLALNVASAWTGVPPADACFKWLIRQPDHWTVYSSVRPFGPFWKYPWPNGEELYPSQSSGDLRSHRPLWSQVVIWLSGAGTVMSILGLVVGLWLYSPSKKYRFTGRPSAILYAGPRRCHVILGLVFGTVTCAGIFSGSMSMHPVSWFNQPERPNLDRVFRTRHLDLSMFAAKPPQQAIHQVMPRVGVEELEFSSLNRIPFFVARQTSDSTRIIPIHGDPQNEFETERILEAVAKAASTDTIASARVVSQYETYYVDRQNRKPLVETYGGSSRWTRWPYHGLNSLDLPWLYARRPQWDILVIGQEGVA